MRPIGKPAVNMAAVSNHLTQRFGSIANLERLAEGEESRAFAFRAGGAALVARINRASEGFTKDDYAYRHFASPALPVPEVVLTATLDGGSVLCVSRRLPGETLQALPAGGAYAYGAAVCALLDALAQTDVSAIADFGRFDANGRGRHGSWRAHVAAVADPAEFDWGRLDAPIRQRVAPLVAVLAAWATTLPDRRGLVHGDFGSNNVLCAEGRITGLIDWSEAMVGDPLYDLANLLFWRPWLDCMEQQCRYMEALEPARLAASETLRCYQLRIGLETVYAALGDGDTRTAQWALARCETIQTRLATRNVHDTFPQGGPDHA